MHILLITPFFPAPEVDSGRTYLYSTALHYRAQGHTVSYAVTDLDYNRELAERWPVPTGTLVWLPERPVRRFSFERMLFHVTTPSITPLKDLLSSVDVAELHWDKLLPLAPRVRRQLRPHAVLSAIPYDVRSMRERRAPTHHGLLSSWLRRKIRASLARIGESFYVNSCSVISQFSRVETALISRYTHGVQTTVLDPVIACEPIGPVERTPTAQATRLLFTGLMKRPENWMSVMWFLNNAWSDLINRVPAATLSVVGRQPPPQLTSHSFPGVEVVGEVPSFGPYYAQADIFIAPLLLGAGVKFKILEAMRWGLPVVATPIGAEGIWDRPGCQGFAAITADPRQMVDSLVNLVEHPETARRLGREAQAWTEHAIDYRIALDRQLSLYQEMISHTPSAGTRTE